MSRVLVVLSALVFLALFSFGVHTPPSAAVWATPSSPNDLQIGPGVTLVPMALGSDRPRSLALYVDPGSSYTFDASDDITLVWVASGTATLTVAAPVSITRSGATQDSAEVIAASTPFRVGSGDYFTIAPEAATEIANTGAEQTYLQIFNMTRYPAR